MSDTNKPSYEELLAKVEKMQRDEARKANPAKKLVDGISVRISSEKKALSVYGLGRFPVTLYKEQWMTLLDAKSVEAIKAFIVANDAALATKPAKTE